MILKKLDVEPFHTHPMTYITLPSRKTTDVVIYKTSSSSVNCGAGARVARADRTVGGRGANEKLRRSDFRFTFPGRPLINPSPPSLVAVCPIYRNSTARSPSPNWSGPATSRPRLSAAPSPRLPPPGYLSYASGVSFFFFCEIFPLAIPTAEIKTAPLALTHTHTHPRKHTHTQVGACTKYFIRDMCSFVQYYVYMYTGKYIWMYAWMCVYKFARIMKRERVRV